MTMSLTNDPRHIWLSKEPAEKRKVPQITMPWYCRNFVGLLFNRALFAISTLTYTGVEVLAVWGCHSYYRTIWTSWQWGQPCRPLQKVDRSIISYLTNHHILPKNFNIFISFIDMSISE